MVGTRATTRRARGTLLRFAFSRPHALAAGLVLSGPAVWITIADYAWENWLSDGLTLVLGATGVALMVIAISGRRPDWVDPGH